MMQLNELRLVSASNIIRLRQAAGLTQAELGARLNYSDKTVSKWERGEAIPDAYTLTVIAELFGVSVDYLLSSHDAWQPPEEETENTKKDEPVYSASVLITLVLVSVWTAALTAFVVLWLFDIVYWQLFVIALPVSLLVLLILERIFFGRRNPQYIIAAFVASLFFALFFLLPGKNPWQLFLIAVPALTIVFLACNLRKNPPKCHEKPDKKQ